MSDITTVFSLLKGALGLFGSGSKKIEYVVTIKHGDIPVCNTRILRTGRGFPWDKKIGAHPLEDGRLELTPIQENSEK